MYRSLKGERLKVDGGSSADMTNNVAVVGNLRVPLAETSASLDVLPQAISLGDTLRIAGMKAAVDGLKQTFDGKWSIKAGQTINLKVLWEALKSPPVDYTLFLHLTPVGATQPIAQVDRLIRPDYPDRKSVV